MGGALGKASVVMSNFVVLLPQRCLALFFSLPLRVRNCKQRVFARVEDLITFFVLFCFGFSI